jgi:hypothetical protein
MIFNEFKVPEQAITLRIFSNQQYQTTTPRRGIAILKAQEQ